MKKYLSVLLASLMLTTLLPMVVFAEEKTYKTGDIIYYGNYPQSLVEDEDELALLEETEKEWIYYDYFSGEGTYGSMKPDDYMRYADIDIDNDGLKDFRAVTFDKYRPYHTECSNEDESLECFQDENNYFTGNIYYFRYEPIEWIVLDPSIGFVTTKKAPDCQPYNNYIICEGEKYTGRPSGDQYANNYFYSSIRKWLNMDFVNTAFSDDQYDNISGDEEIISSCYLSYYQEFASKCNDKIFLLSYEEILNDNYGFDSYTGISKKRLLNGTDYAECQGLLKNPAGNVWWWLRSTGYYEYSDCAVRDDGFSNYHYVVTATGIAVRPACRLYTLCDNTAKSPIDNNLIPADYDFYAHNHTAVTITIPASCTIPGLSYAVCTDCGVTIGEATVIPAAHTSITIEIPSTCTTAGMRYSVCTECGITTDEPVILPLKEHIPGEWEITIQPTTENEGRKILRCTVCGEIIEEAVIPKLQVITSSTGVQLVINGEDYDGAVSVDVTSVFDGTSFNLINAAVNNTQSVIFDITMSVDGDESQPNGTLVVRIPMPDGFDAEHSFVYHVNSKTGVIEKMPSHVEDGYIVFETTHFSYYAVVEETPENTSDNICACNCHKNGLMNFIWKIMNIINRLFGKNPVCACGVKHY